MLKLLARLSLMLFLVLSATLIFHFEISNVEGVSPSGGLKNKASNIKLNRLGRTVNNVDDSLFIRSKTDDSEYKFLRLGNNMSVFLVSNKSFTKSVVTLSMKIGSVSDPEDLPGFVDIVQGTICFFSNNKEDSSKFCSYLESMGGTVKIEVLDRNTIFTIEVENAYIIRVLNIFSEAIKNPVFSENLLYTEVEKKIDSFGDLIRDEEFVFQCVKRDISTYDSVYKRQKTITTGSIEKAEVNSGLKLPGRIKQFQKRNYSSNTMTIVVASNESIAKLIKGVTSNFSSIKDLKLRNILPQDLFKVVRHPHTGNIGNVIHLHSDINSELILEFPIEYQEILWDSFPGKYLEYLLNDSSDYSLMSYLISKDLIKTMSSKTVSENYGFSNFEISFVLTESGVERIKTILQATFMLIEHIKKAPVSNDIISEIQESMRNKFDYHFNVSPEHISRQILYSFDTRGCSPEEVLIAGNLIRSPDLTEIKRFMGKISTKNLIIYLKHLNKIRSVFNSNDVGISGDLSNYEGVTCHDLNGGDASDIYYIGEDQQNDQASSWDEDGFDSSYVSSSVSVSLEFMDENENINQIESVLFNKVKYYVDSIPKEVLRQIKAAIEKVKLDHIGVRMRRANKLLKKVHLNDFKDTANYRIYSPIYLRNALLDFFSGETLASQDGIHLSKKEALEDPVLENIIFSNNVDLKRQVSRLFLRYMIPEQTRDAPKLATILDSNQLVLTLEVLVYCLRHVSSRVINDMSDLSGSFSITTNISSEFMGVPFGFEIIVKGSYFGSVYVSIEEFTKRMRNLGRLISPSRYQLIIGQLDSESKMRMKMGSKSSSMFILKSIFECQKLSKYVLETVDYSKIKLEQVLELSDYLINYGTIESVIIGNISPLHAYSLIKVVSCGNSHKRQVNNKLKASLKSDSGGSIGTWKILDPFSTNFYTNNFYYYNDLYNKNDNNSNSLLYVPFSTLSLDTFYFKIIIGMLIDLLKGRGLTEGIEFDLYPNIHQFIFVGFCISYTSSNLNVLQISERLLSVFFKVFNLLKSVDMDQFNAIFTNKRSINSKIDPDHEQIENRVFHSIVCRKDISSILNNVKTHNYKLGYEKFVEICNRVLDAPKFLISTQARIEDSDKLTQVRNYTPSGFLRLNSIYDITEQEGVETFEIPISYTKNNVN